MNLLAPKESATEIVEDPEGALAQFSLIAGRLAAKG